MNASTTLTAGTASQDREFDFTPADFERVRTLIYQHAGISLNAGKQAMVYSRLSRRLRETGQTSFSSYLQWLEVAQGSEAEAEWQQFVNCLTTNLTSFFREAHHFEALSELLKTWSGSSCRLWCNASSTGEEPYSLAMTLVESLRAGCNMQILATDIDTQVLNTARQGVYSADARGLSPQRLKQHFLKGTGVNSGSIRIKPDVARLIDFRTFNLMSSNWSLGEPFDLIFCRNVMIYFDHATQRRVLEQIHRVLKPQGLLFVGHSENFSDAKGLFALQGKTIYKRVS